VSDYDNTNRGVMFKNDRKEQATHADYRGTINVEGKDYWLNCWVKESKKDGRKFFSLSVKEKGVNAPPQIPQAAETGTPDFDDEVPF
jgi:hypothetical protein